MEENNIEPVVTRRASKTVDGRRVRLDIVLPNPGETATFEVPRYNLTVLVERGAIETQEQLRERYTVVAPTGNDRRLHAARLGVGATKAKRLALTLCSQSAPAERAIQSGNRLDGVPLDTVTCIGCVKIMKDEGIEIKGANA